MKFEKLNETKIRIILSTKDMESNNLSVEQVLSNSADSQKLLETMITKAEEELNFKTDDSQLLVEALASINNECIFTITKLLDDTICCLKSINSFVYKFNSFDDFINLCTFIKNFTFLCLKEISRNFSLSYHNNTYYLHFANIEKSCIVLDYLKPFFNEFGTDVSNSVGIEGILNEYGKTIFSKNAISKCINCFVLQ